MDGRTCDVSGHERRKARPLMLNYYHGSAAQVPKPAAATATNGLKEKLPSLSGEPEPVEAQLSHVVFCFLLPVFMLIEARTLLFPARQRSRRKGTSQLHGQHNLPRRVCCYHVSTSTV